MSFESLGLESEVRALPATDIASRGLDVGCLPRCVNFAQPDVPESYACRIARAGRGGGDGAALTLVSPKENQRLDGSGTGKMKPSWIFPARDRMGVTIGFQRLDVL